MNDAVETIRSRQIGALRQLINLNEPAVNTMVSEPVWKVLIMDKFGQEIISPLLPVKQLRELGVTLHMLIGNKREPLPDVPAVYFVSPSDENVDLICEDLKKAMYESYYLNFVNPLSRIRLETLASSAVNGGTVANVKKVVDQYLNFISLEDDLFVLKRNSESSPMSYYAINDPSTSDIQMESMIDSIADALFSVCATLGIVPIIRSPKDNAAEHVATRLDQKLRDNLRDARNNLFAIESVRAGQLHTSRPLLLIADRSADLATMLHHTWTYQALIHDVLELDQNRVTMVEKGKKVDYDLHCGHDKLWTKHKGSAFPLVAEAVQEDLETYRSSKDEIERLKHAMGMEGSDADAAMSTLLTDTTSKLGSTVTSLPQLLEQKRLIDLHTNVATTLLDAIKERKLDVLFELEQKLLQKTPLDIPLTSLLSELSSPEDILRVVLIHFLCSDGVSKAEMEELRKLLQEKGADDGALRFVEKLRSISSLGRGLVNEDHSGAGTKTVSMFGKLLDKSSKFVMEGVKNLVPKKHNLPLTRMVDSLCTPPSSSVVGISSMGGSTSHSETDSLRYFDPKLMHQLNKDTSKLRHTTPPQDVILFVIGGGNYVEYENLCEWGKSKGMTRVTYGTTELINPGQFTQQDHRTLSDNNCVYCIYRSCSGGRRGCRRRSFEKNLSPNNHQRVQTYRVGGESADSVDRMTIRFPLPPSMSSPSSLPSIFILLLRLSLLLFTVQMVIAQEYESSGVDTTSLSMILDRLTNRTIYDKRLRPRYGDKPVDVGITIHVSSISAVSEVDMDFTLDFYMRQTWQDPRLAFGAIDTGNGQKITSLTVGVDYLDKLWKPDTFFPNEKKSFFHVATTHNSFLRIESDGTVYTSQRLTVTATCPMKLQLFPMDSQRCKLEIESYGYSVLDIVYTFRNNQDGVSRSEFELPQFVLKDVQITNRTEKLSSGEYSRLVCYFLFTRNIGFYLIQIYLPSILIVIISWVSFWLSRDATPARVALGVTTVLTMTTLMTTTNSSMPKVSYVKSIDIFLGTSFMMVFCSLLEYATIGYLSKRLKIFAQRKKSSVRSLLCSSPTEPPTRTVSVPAYFNNGYRPFYSSTDTNSNLFIHHGQRPPVNLKDSDCHCPRPLPSTPKMSLLVTHNQFAQKSFDWKIFFRPSNVDKYSRIMFPMIYLLFNVGYWSHFIRISHFESELSIDL